MAVNPLRLEVRALGERIADVRNGLDAVKVTRRDGKYSTLVSVTYAGNTYSTIQLSFPRLMQRMKTRHITPLRNFSLSVSWIGGR